MITQSTQTTWADDSATVTPPARHQRQHETRPRKQAKRPETEPPKDLVIMERLKSPVVFTRIVKASATQWIPGTNDPRARRARGSVETRQRRQITPELTYNAKAKEVQLQVVYAHRIKHYSGRFVDLLNRVTRGQPNSLASPDSELRQVRLCAAADCPPFDELIPSAVRRLFERFATLLSHDLLIAAIEVGEGELCGAVLLEPESF